MTAMITATGFSAWYGQNQALENVSLTIEEREIFGIIGPANSGKTTFLRSINRMNDLIASFTCEGELSFRGVNLYDERLNVPLLRRKIGMVFAVPTPLPGSIFHNLQLGPRLHAKKTDLDDLVEKSLQAAFLWDEVKDRLDQSATNLSGGQQQRLCLARTLMLEPDALLLDEPCSGLDPISTAKIEEALVDLKREITVVLVTNNVMQSSRIADRTAFLLQGRLVECKPTKQLFVSPTQKETYDYISGRFG
jgi:phosphate transport system ATP-binding protein